MTHPVILNNSNTRLTNREQRICKRLSRKAKCPVTVYWSKDEIGCNLLLICIPEGLTKDGVRQYFEIEEIVRSTIPFEECETHYESMSNNVKKLHNNVNS